MMTNQLKNIEQIQPKPIKLLSTKLLSLIEKQLWLKVIIAMFAGLMVGILVGPSVGWVDSSTSIGNWLALPGQLFLAIIQMIVIPLVFASIILGIASSEDVAQLKKLGIIVSIYFVLTTAIASFIGISVALLLSPGNTLANSGTLFLSKNSNTQNVNAIEASSPPTLHELPEVMIQLLPGNPLTSMVEGQMLQIVIFALIFGIALVSMPPSQSKPLIELLNSLQQVCMTIVKWAMWLAPIAVFGLMARLTSQVGLSALIGMSHYVATVILGLTLLLLFYLVLLFIFAQQNPISFLKNTRELLLLAFSTSSSAAVMPLSIKTAEEKLGIKRSISQFVIPLGATINMNGTALYQAVAAIFLAQAYNIDISLSGMILIVTMAVGASIGSPGTPGVGIVILATILVTVGIPAEGIALIMGVDRILDMARTAINVAGDIVAAKLMSKWTNESNENTDLEIDQA